MTAKSAASGRREASGYRIADPPAPSNVERLLRLRECPRTPVRGFPPLNARPWTLWAPFRYNPPVMTNTLYYGDNLDILRRHVADQSVDLIYLDPPFNSNADYNILFAERNGTRAASARIYDSPWGTKHARIQILTVAGLLAGHDRIGMPPSGDLRTFRKAPKATKRGADRDGLFETDS